MHQADPIKRKETKPGQSIFFKTKATILAVFPFEFVIQFCLVGPIDLSLISRKLVISPGFQRTGRREPERLLLRTSAFLAESVSAA